MIDVNIYQENQFHTKMIIKNSALDHSLFGPGGDDYSAWSLRDIERRLKQEIAKTYGG
jgi:S-adenosylmethionine decarboxylase